MFAELYRGKADLSSSALVGTSERLAVVDFTIPMGHYYVGLVGLGSSQSDNPEMSPDSFFVIFTPWSWFATLLGACLLAIVLSFISKHSTKRI